MDEFIQSRDSHMEEYYMSKALQVAESALKIGEVPVGCVIVLRDAVPFLEPQQAKNALLSIGSYAERSVIISHGANQVNACRDSTRHAEIVAIDRMLTGGVTSDWMCLPRSIVSPTMAMQNTERVLQGVTKDSSYDDTNDGNHKSTVDDVLENVQDDCNHWKNTFGWGSGRIFKKNIFPKCDLYVTCEPCIMCAAALAKLGIGRVFFGCKNDRFGGCGSLLNLHEPFHRGNQVDGVSRGYPIVAGLLERKAIYLLRSFYDRENFHAPEEKRKRKDHALLETA